MNIPAQVYTVDDFGYTYIFYKVSPAHNFNLVTLPFEYCCCVISKGTAQGTHPDGTPRKHKLRYNVPKVVKGDNYAVDMLYIMDHSVFEHYLARHHNHTHKTWKFLIEYGSILMYEVRQGRFL